MGRRRQNRGDRDPFERQTADPDRVAAALFDDLEAVGRPTVLNLSEIRTDGGTQPREKLDQALIEEYAEDITGGAVFPPIEVFYDGANYWLVDGFHRLHAHEQANKNTIRAVIHQGDQRAAVLYSLGVNADHGKRRTNEDKRRAVMVLFNDPEWAKWSDREIARQCKVSNVFVSKMRNDLSVNRLQIGEKKRKVQRGDQTYTMKTKRGQDGPQSAPEPRDSGPADNGRPGDYKRALERQPAHERRQLERGSFSNLPADGSQADQAVIDLTGDIHNLADPKIRQIEAAAWQTLAERAGELAGIDPDQARALESTLNAARRDLVIVVRYIDRILDNLPRDRDA